MLHLRVDDVSIPHHDIVHLPTNNRALQSKSKGDGGPFTITIFPMIREHIVEEGGLRTHVRRNHPYSHTTAQLT